MGFASGSDATFWAAGAGAGADITGSDVADATLTGWLEAIPGRTRFGASATSTSALFLEESTRRNFVWPAGADAGLETARTGAEATCVWTAEPCAGMVRRVPGVIWLAFCIPFAARIWLAGTP